MSETPFLIREAPATSFVLPTLTPQVSHPIVVAESAPGSAAMRSACDTALLALDTYAAQADYRGRDNGTFARQLGRYASRAVWSMGALTGAAAALLTRDPTWGFWSMVAGAAATFGVVEALPALRRSHAGDKPLSPGAVSGFSSENALEQQMLSRLANNVMADMTAREIFGNEARARLEVAAAQAGFEGPLSATADRLVKLVLALPSRFHTMDAVDDDHAMAILEAYTALAPEEREVGRQLVREKLLEARNGPDMTAGVWQSLYDLTRPQAPTAGGES